METGWRRNYLRYKSFFLNMMTQYRERSDWKAYLEILLSLVTISIFSVFALRPTILTIAELIKQIEEKKTTVAKMDEKIQHIGRAQTTFDRESANINLLTNVAIPTNPNSDVFARQVEGLSAKHQVTVSAVTLGEGNIKGVLPKEEAEAENEGQGERGEEFKPYSETHFTVIATGSVEEYEALLNFAKDFENLRVNPIVSTIDLSVKGEDITRKVLSLLIEGKLPYLEEKKIPIAQ